MADEDFYSTASDVDVDVDADDGSAYSVEDDDLDVLVEERAVDDDWSIASVIPAESLLVAQKEDLQKVMDLLVIKEQQARTLLMFYRWNVERVYELFERKGKERLCQEAGVPISDDRSLSILTSSTMIKCKVCFEDVSALVATKMDCGHFFCDECWMENFVVRIKDGESRSIRCMAPECNAICDEAIVRSLVSRKDPCIADRFERSLVESYVEDNDMVKWCPSKPHCGNAIRVEGDNVCEVECKCGLQFCFNCLLEAHSPCSCQMWKLWVEKCNDESGSLDWILVNTKSCPKCHKPVEKNGGCNLVRCRCGQYFCWLCGGATGSEHTWTTIAGHSCNRFKEETRSVEAVRRRLDRYMHYYMRYKAHTDSFKKENSLKQNIQRKILISESKESKIKDYSWVLDGLQRLFRSRRVLSYTYPFAFCMFGDELLENGVAQMEKEMKQNLFEDQQEQLESNVERLSMYLEKEFHLFSDEEVIETKIQVVNLSRIVDNFCMQMYKWIEDELLELLKHAVHRIAPYRSLERALEFSTYGNSDHNSVGMKANSDDRFTGRI